MRLPSPQAIDRFSSGVDASVRASVYEGTRVPTEWRREILARDYEQPDVLRKLAAQVKQHTMDHLEDYLVKAEQALLANGAEVYFAETVDRAKSMALEVLQRENAKTVVKSKSMLTEELHLNSFLAQHGIECVETDLGEYVIQIDDDVPSHIIKPIVHKNRRDIAKSFEREGLGAYNDDPETITRRARVHLRKSFLRADCGMTGANFVSAESGRIVLVTNEGNARWCTTAPRLHIVMVGIEKLVPRDKDLGLFLNLLARSAVGQQLTVYTQFVNGPRSIGKDGPDKMVVIFVDNGRSEVLGSDYREILRCIRCGACQNVCPVYRQATGHAYRATYQGPIGAVLSPLLGANDFEQLADLPKASSLCGACNEVCPVDIPIPNLLLRLRDRAFREGAGMAKKGTPPMAPWAWLATHPGAWRSALTMANAVPMKAAPVPAMHRWLGTRELPAMKGGAFRRWWRKHQKADS
ncbi:MAG: iron-sulfur cluster-binding protein [Verrucomicrobiaceae bacterium]|nr:iron-sulfur cluster-binding protein [Verrucomicrobiaceae bacterium]